MAMGDIFDQVLIPNFVDNHYEKEPALSRTSFDFGATFESIFGVLPAIHKAGHIRYINEHTGVLGTDPKLIEEKLAAFSKDPQVAYRRLFESNEFSFAIQSLESHFPQVQRFADWLGEVLHCRFSTTAFVSPPNSAATKPHYDKSEVFAVQLHGKKTWSLSSPVDALPTMRNFDVPVDDTVDPTPFARYELNPGDLLYVPRGWVHGVVNHSDTPSIHLSFVGFVDAWVSVFGNLMDAAYIKLRNVPAWRESVSAFSIKGSGTEARIRTMSEQLLAEMLDLLSDRPERFLDHCLNGSEQRFLVNEAKSSIDYIDSDDDVWMELVGVHHVWRRADDAKHVRLSTDNINFFEVDERIYAALLKGRVNVGEMAASNQFSEDSLLASLKVLVKTLGICRFGCDVIEAEGA